MWRNKTRNYKLKKLNVMKRVMLPIVILAFYSCMKNRSFVLSTADQAAFDGMNDAYELAYAYNDSLKSSSDSTFIEYCDDMFHEHETNYNHHHGNYNHNEGHSDHGSNGGMMNGCCGGNNHDNDEAHHSYHHNQFDALLEDHQQYHP